MKKKKALLVLMVIAIMVAVGGMATLVLQYFADTAASRNAGGDLSLDYYVTDEEENSQDEGQQTSQNIFQWLIDKLTSDKENAEGNLAEDMDTGGQTSSGVSQNHRDDSEEVEENEAVEEQTEAPDNTEIQPNIEPDEDDKENEPQEEEQQEETPLPEESPDTPKGNTVTLTIRCDTAVAKGMNTEAKWAGIVPSSGVILPVTEIEIEPGETVFSVLSRASSQYKFQMEYSGTNGAEYIEGINNLYEFDGGRWSGWMYCVNGWYPNYGCGQYALKDGDVIEWNYTCDLGKDLGQEWMGEDWTETHE